MNAPTLLFADNDPRFLHIRKEFLEAKGYEVLPANNPAEAKNWIKQRKINLAILDIRLLDDTDDTDLSGLILSKQLEPHLPIIFLTGFPTWEAVREAFGAHLNGSPRRNDFIAKKEGPEALLQAIDWALNQPQLRENILRTFETPNRMALVEKIQHQSVDEAATQLRSSFQATAAQLRTYQEQVNRRAAQYHSFGLGTSIMGVGLVMVGIILIFLQELPSTAITFVASAISHAASALFFNQQKHAHHLVSLSFERLNEINNLGNLLTVSDTLVTPESREEYKKKILDKLIVKL